jgi:hypothetical protein
MDFFTFFTENLPTPNLPAVQGPVQGLARDFSHGSPETIPWGTPLIPGQGNHCTCVPCTPNPPASSPSSGNKGVFGVFTTQPI